MKGGAESLTLERPPSLFHASQMTCSTRLIVIALLAALIDLDLPAFQVTRGAVAV